MDKDNISWYVVRTKQNAEKKVAERLEAIQLECFLPLYQTIRIWSDRKKKLKVPLIPNHLFVHCKKEDLKLVYTILGVHSLLMEKGKPGVVRDVEIQNLRILTLLEEKPNLIPSVDLKIGTEITVTEGPLKGLVGSIAKETKGQKIYAVFNQLGLTAVLPFENIDVKKMPE